MSLSDKIILLSAGKELYPDVDMIARIDVKEFIQELIDKGEPITIDEIKELAGKDLIK